MIIDKVVDENEFYDRIWIVSKEGRIYQFGVYSDESIEGFREWMAATPINWGKTSKIDQRIIDNKIVYQSL